MPPKLSLLKIGSRVNIDLTSVKDRIPRDLIELLEQDPVGTVLDYKMTDGNGIGVILQLSNNSTSWFFEDEINFPELSQSSDYNSNPTNSVLGSSYNSSRPQKTKLIITDKYWALSSQRKKDISHILNPLNFIKWLFYSFKDVF